MAFEKRIPNYKAAMKLCRQQIAELSRGDSDQPVPTASDGSDRFEVIDVVMLCNIREVGHQIRFAVRNRQTQELHRNFMGIIGDGPGIAFVQTATDVLRRSMDWGDGQVGSPGRNRVAFTNNDAESILRQLIIHLNLAFEDLTSAVPALHVAANNGGLTFERNVLDNAGQPYSSRNQPVDLIITTALAIESMEWQPDTIPAPDTGSPSA